MTDVIDTLAGIKAGSALDKARDNRPEARKQAARSSAAPSLPSSQACMAARKPGTSMANGWRKPAPRPSCALLWRARS
jgi:hypothetical protein